MSTAGREAYGARVKARQVTRRLDLWAERAGIEGGVHPHQLRHTFGQRVYARTRDVLVVARALTHGSVASAAMHARAGDEAVREAVAGR